MKTTNPKDLFNCRRYGSEKSNKVVFFFSAMLTRLWQFRWFFWMMNRSGYVVYGFDFKEKEIFLTYNASEFEKFLFAIRQEVKGYIQSEKTQGAISFAVFGVSMGNIYALNCAKYIKEIDKVIINLTYGSMANNFWTYKRHRSALVKFLKGVSSVKELRKELGSAETIDNLKALKSKKLLVFSDRKDKRLPDTLQFRNELEKSGVKAEYHYSNLGHVLGGFVNLVNKKRWLNFLES